METVTRQVSSLEPAIREAIGAIVGHSLQANQQIVVQVLDVEPAADEALKKPKLPGWCGVFTYLTADEEAALALSIAGRTESRSIPTSRS
jgi:hypothetical protein